jgi:hypothetical protein
MGRTALCVAFLGLILGLGASSSWAQQKQTQSQQQPATQKPSDTRVAPPAAPIAPLTTEKTKNHSASTDQNQSAPSTPEQRPLSGVEEYTLSTMGMGHSYFFPVFQVAESGDTNGNNQIGSATFESVSTVSGAFALNRVWSRYNFAANYSGSGFIYNRDPSQSSSAHSFSLSQTITGARSSLVLADAVSYLPESSYGYARFGSFGNFGVGGFSPINSSGLNGIYIPSQSILTGDSTRISNVVVGQYDYKSSPLSSLTFTGSYGMLRFLDTGFIDSNAGTFGLGYNHSFTARDTLAIAYMGTVYRYDQSVYDFNTHIVALMYGHQISHLLSLKLGGGPLVNTFTGSNTTNQGTVVSWYGNASLYYRLPRTTLSFFYTHYTSAGAGVFQGSKTDNLTMTITRQLTRIWSGDVSMGYSHNANLQATSTSQSFNTWYASANLQRPIGHYMNLFLSYNLQQQSSNNSFCNVGGCGSFYTRNYFSLGFNWHPNAVELGGIN